MNILRIDSSLFGDNSVSHQLADELVARLLSAGGQVVSRDLAAEAAPHFDGERIASLMTPAEQRTEQQQAIVDYADEQIAQVKAADVLVIGAPMYNFSVPSVLKAWFDHIARAGVTFEYTSTGPRGLLTGKRAYVISTRGGLHRGMATDTQAAFITQFLGFLGITDVHVIYAEGLNMGADQRGRGLDEARSMMDTALAA
jgi:FMN-dependent NADH-azoreductase